LEKMKIAYFSADYPPRVCDGLGIYVESIFRELAALGNTVSIFTIGGSGLKKREGRKGIRVFREVPFPMNDGIKPFLSEETSEPLIDLLSYNQLAAARLRDESPTDENSALRHCRPLRFPEPLRTPWNRGSRSCGHGKAIRGRARGVSGLREIVESWDASRPTGIHMNGWDPKDIAWGVNMALDDPERLKQWGRNARERCTNDFTWRKAAERTLEIYHEVLAKLGRNYSIN